jgi:hypothetical protein
VGLEADARRLEVAMAYGCLRFRSGSKALRAWARERDGAGVEGVVDASGHSAALVEAMDLVRQAGFITKVGWGPQPLGVSLDPIVQKRWACGQPQPQPRPFTGPSRPRRPPIQRPIGSPGTSASWPRRPDDQLPAPRERAFLFVNPENML